MNLWSRFTFVFCTNSWLPNLFHCNLSNGQGTDGLSAVVHRLHGDGVQLQPPGRPGESFKDPLRGIVIGSSTDLTPAASEQDSLSQLTPVWPVGERDGLHELHPHRGRLLRDRVEGEQRHNSWFVLLIFIAVIVVLLIVLLILVAVIIVLLIILVIEGEKIDVCITWPSLSSSLSSLLSSLSSLSSLVLKKSAQMRSMFLPRLQLLPSLLVQSWTSTSLTSGDSHFEQTSIWPLAFVPTSETSTAEELSHAWYALDILTLRY